MQEKYYPTVQRLIDSTTINGNQRKAIIAANNFAVGIAAMAGFNAPSEAFDAVEYQRALERLVAGDLNNREEFFLELFAYNSFAESSSRHKIIQLVPPHILGFNVRDIRAAADAILAALAVMNGEGLAPCTR